MVALYVLFPLLLAFDGLLICTSQGACAAPTAAVAPAKKSTAPAPVLVSAAPIEHLNP